MIQNFPFLFPILRTERLVLRRLKEDDSYEIMLLRSNPEVNIHIKRPPSINQSEATDFIKNIHRNIQSDKSFYWAIALKTNDRLIGTICYWNFSAERKIAEIGYELNPDHQNKGIMQEAIEAVINWGFDTLKLEKIIAFTNPGNIRSNRLLLKNNFTPDKQYAFLNKENPTGLSAYFLSRADNNT